jgi:hypothetical protein
MHGHKAAQRWLGGFSILACLLVTTACAPLQTERLLKTADAFPEPVELEGVPFFPQEDFQCGPAALATALRWNGVDITPEQLVPQIYVPERQGSFQLELVSATRRHGLIPYTLEPELESVVAEVASGNPVIVLQNLGLSFAPTWHYAVVVGFDLEQENIVLRSGRERRHVINLRTFERTWERGEHWALVALPPDKLPFTAQELRYLQSVTALERIGMKQAASLAYATALKRWPQSMPALMGLGNTRYALGDLRGAERAFRLAVQQHPRSAPAHNNLAQTLVDQKRYIEAQEMARRAVELGAGEPLAEIYRQTYDTIVAARPDRLSR